MQSLAEYLASNPDGYKVDADSIIRSPGKFEGERLYVPYFYGVGLEGFADETGQLSDGTTWDAFTISPEDLAQSAQHFSGDGPDPEILILYYSDSGFVSCDTTTRADFEVWSKDPLCQDMGEEG